MNPLCHPYKSHYLGRNMRRHHIQLPNTLYVENKPFSVCIYPL